VEPVWLSWELETALLERLVLEARRGLGGQPPVMLLDEGRGGHELALGIERYRWRTESATVRIARVLLPCKSYVQDFWAVPTDQYRSFYRLLRRHFRQKEELPPIMHEESRRRLWDNTVGFLRDREAELRRFGVTPKRGVLLLGQPGNGKTMACRWLAGECCRRGLQWRTVTAEMYDDARSERRLPHLFRLDAPGIILFDDFDAALRKREELGDGNRQSTFLGELDGMGQKTGLVFLFTSNAKLAELDPAMCRPGRLDVVIRFLKPDAELRRQVVSTRWHPELAAGVDVDTVVADTQGFSFAEIEESKKLLAMRYVETRQWDWPWVRQAMGDRHQAHELTRPIGFCPGRNGNHHPAPQPAER